MPSVPSALDLLPSMGWVVEPSPLQSMTAMAAALGLEELMIKRDDLLPALGGGNKVRKLDLLLARPPYIDAPIWHASGAIGSGQLVASARASQELGRKLIAHCCDQPISPGVVQNLAMTAVAAHELHYYRSRFSMAVRRPELMIADSWRGQAILPPGATSGAGTAGFVRAAFELADQLQARSTRVPERIYLPLGSGGAAVGLAVGLALAGVRSAVHAVSTVERIFVTTARIRSVKRAVLRWLDEHGVDVPSHLPLRLVIDRSQIGRGYAHPSPASLTAVERMSAQDIRMEAVYSGKAMAALLHDATSLRGERVLFWLTCHGIRPPRPAVDWMRNLPEPLRKRLAGDRLARGQ